MKKAKVAILGSGNIGTDLLVKALRSLYLDCTIFIGRNLYSAGMSKASSLGVKISDRGIQAIIDNPDLCDIVFDATSALDAQKHWDILNSFNKIVIDMTPAKIGKMCVPAVNLEKCLDSRNINMVTCGGQASIPIVYTISQTIKDIEYMEVVSSIASRSAGPATRLNIDEYIDTTENAIQKIGGCRNSKTILILNPANPCVNMQTTIFTKTNQPDMNHLKVNIHEMVLKIKEYVPGYDLVVDPVYENGRLVVMVKVFGMGDYLPKYAGNLDIINCAAIATAEEFVKKGIVG